MPKKEVLRPGQCDTPGEVAKILTSINARLDSLETIVAGRSKRLGVIEDKLEKLAERKSKK